MKWLFFIRSTRREKSFQAESMFLSIYINFYIDYSVAGGMDWGLKQLNKPGNKHRAAS